MTSEVNSQSDLAFKPLHKATSRQNTYKDENQGDLPESPSPWQSVVELAERVILNCSQYFECHFLPLCEASYACDVHAFI
jgi:hypothetical protein